MLKPTEYKPNVAVNTSQTSLVTARLVLARSETAGNDDVSSRSKNFACQIMSKFSSDDLKYQSDPLHFNDFRDGDLYKEILDGEDGDDIRAQKAFTQILKSDGISMGDDTKMTAWAFYANIIETPIETRFTINNSIILG